MLMKTLQAMLLQTEDKTILLLPAWPADWDVDFKLHAPYNTVVEGGPRRQAGQAGRDAGVASGGYHRSRCRRSTGLSSSNEMTWPRELFILYAGIAIPGPC